MNFAFGPGIGVGVVFYFHLLCQLQTQHIERNHLIVKGWRQPSIGIMAIRGEKKKGMGH